MKLRLGQACYYYQQGGKVWDFLSRSPNKVKRTPPTPDTEMCVSLSIKKILITQRKKAPPRVADIPASRHVHSPSSGQPCALHHFCFSLRVKWQFY